MSESKSIDVHDAQARMLAQSDPYADMMRAAIEQGEAGVKALERLVELQERREAAEAERQFNAAMARFQAICPPIPRRTKGAHNAKYARRDDIMKAIRPALAECGLSVTFDHIPSDDDKHVMMIAHVRHAGGHCHTTQPMKVAKEAPSNRMNATQRDGSANEYAARYVLGNALGITTGEEDDDGRSASDVPSAEPVTEEQAADLRAMVEEVGEDPAAFLARAGVDTFAAFPARMYERALKYLEGRR